MAGIWDTLGTAPTIDRTVIKRAYATRLKAASPEADPQGFARLRAAYERALALAEAPVPQKATPKLPNAPADISPPAPCPDEAEVDGVEKALARGDVVAAAVWLVAARPGLTIVQEINLTDRLGWAMAQDANLGGAAVREAAGQLGWTAGPGLDGVMAGSWGRTLRARLDAERWLAELRKDAASGTRLVAGARAVAARIMLGSGRMRALAIMGRDRTLRQRYGEYLLHAGVVSDQFDPERIATIGRTLTAKPDTPRSPLSLLLGIVVIAWIVGAITGAIDPGIRDGATGSVAIGVFLALWTRRLSRGLRRLLRRRSG